MVTIIHPPNTVKDRIQADMNGSDVVALPHQDFLTSVTLLPATSLARKTQDIHLRILKRGPL